MRVFFLIFALGLGLATPSTAATPARAFLDGVEGRWSNALQTFFAKETGETELGLALHFARDGESMRITVIDEAARPLDSDDPEPTRMRVVGRDRIEIRDGVGGVCLYRVARTKTGLEARSDCDGGRFFRLEGEALATNQGEMVLKLRKARPFQCWAAILSGAKHGDSGAGAKPEDWSFTRDVWIHDQGGEARVTSRETPPRSLKLVLRRVEWPSGPNRPSLTLYVHEAGAPRALSYAWSEYDAERIGINLRWMQASCTHAPGVEPKLDP